MKKNIFIFSKYPTKEDPEIYIFIKNRVEALKKEFDITVVSLDLNSESDSIIRHAKDGYQHIILKIKVSKIPKLRVVFIEKKIYKMLFKIIKKDLPKLIEVHFSSYYSWVISKICSRIPIPYIITEHASFFEERINNPYLEKRIKKSINDADKVVAVSNYLRTIMNKKINRDIEVVPNIVDTNSFKPNSLVRSNKIPKMITVGRFDKADTKGYFLLLESLRQLKDEQYDFECVFVGDGQEFDIFKDKLASHNLLDKVTLLGSIQNEQLVDHYNSSDFYVSTSKRETFGVAIIEAMSCGLPVVSTKSGGPESFIHEEVGLLCEYDIPDITRNLKRMLTTYQNYDAKKIRLNVVNNFSADIYRMNMNNLYSNIVKTNDVTQRSQE